MYFRFSNNPAYWHDRAAEACTMASTADAEAKAILLRLANDFVRLADVPKRVLNKRYSALPKGCPQLGSWLARRGGHSSVPPPAVQAPPRNRRKRAPAGC